MPYSHQYGFEEELTPTIYEISNFGRVRNSLTGRILKNDIYNSGYPISTIKINGELKHITLHKMIGITFIQKRTKELNMFNHKDGIKTNSALYNLEICNSSHNARHALENGLKKVRFGENGNTAKYPDSLIIALCEKMSKGYYPLSELSKEFGLPTKYIVAIRRKCIRKDVCDKYEFVKYNHTRKSKKYSDENIILASKLLEKGMRPKDVSKQTGIHLDTVHLIRRRRVYKNLIGKI